MYIVIFLNDWNWLYKLDVKEKTGKSQRLLYILTRKSLVCPKTRVAVFVVSLFKHLFFLLTLSSASPALRLIHTFKFQELLFPVFDKS